MKIALIGYGKMGHIIEQVALKRGHTIVCIIDKDNQADFESDAFQSADVAIEFTTPATAKDNILRAWQNGVPVVSGTTGWMTPPDPLCKGEMVMSQEADNSWVWRDKQGKKWLVWKSNFSIGVNVLFELNKRLAELLAPYPQYAPSIEEIHHIHKLDKPSGTAKTLATSVEEVLKVEKVEVPIMSIREGEVPGTHTVTWDSEEDTIVIQHIAKGREGFALGAVIEAEKLTPPSPL